MTTVPVQGPPMELLASELISFLNFSVLVSVLGCYSGLGDEWGVEGINVLAGIAEIVNMSQSIWCRKGKKKTEAGAWLERPGKSPSRIDFNCSVGHGELLKVFQESNMLQPGIFK